MTILNEWRRKDCRRNVFHRPPQGIRRKRNLRTNGRHAVTHLWETEVWKMETMRKGYCGITARRKKKCVFPFSDI
jgi:hypothetical protein